MNELTKIQAEHLKKLLSIEHVSKSAFAKKVGVTPVTVSRWVNGKSGISQYNAGNINAEYPDYSVEYLLGYTEHPNEEVAIWEMRRESNERFFAELECVEGLLKLNGIAVECFSEWIDDSQDYIVTIEPHESLTATTHREYARLIRDEETITLTIDQWRAFRDEINSYVGMRLNKMFERGCW